MAKLGWIKASPRYPAAAQREKLVAWGAAKIYEYRKDTDDVHAVVKSARPRDVIGVVGIHRFADNMKGLALVMHAIGQRKIPIDDLDVGLQLTEGAVNALAALANAKRVFDGEARGTPEEMAERGGKGGRKTAKTRRVPLGKEHRQIWFASTTNDEAAKKVSKLMGRKVSVQTLRRKFGPSGRTAGWPPKR